MLAFNVALVVYRIGIKLVVEGVDDTEPADLLLSGNSTRGKAVEQARQEKFSMQVDMNFIFKTVFTDRTLNGRREYSVQCEDGLSATSFDNEILINSVCVGNEFWNYFQT